jgi:hypothetical protein
MSHWISPSQVGDDALNPAPILRPYLTSKQLGSDLGDFLEIFIKNGTAVNYGALLIESLPESRYVLCLTLNKSYVNTVQTPLDRVLSNLSDRPLASINYDGYSQNRRAICPAEARPANHRHGLATLS